MAIATEVIGAAMNARGEVITGNVQLDDEKLMELRHQLNAYHDHAVGYHEGELGVRVRDGWDYYYKLLPKPIVEGSSKQIMPIVWTTVNGVLAELTSTFTSGEDVVKFAPLDSQDGVAAMAATKMVNKVFLHENNGYTALHDCLKECLVARNGFMKHYWNKEKKTFVEEFEDLTKEQVDLYLASIEGDILEVEVNESQSVILNKDLTEKKTKKLKGEKEPEPKDVKYEGKVTYAKTTEGVKVEYVPFEEIIIEPTARSMTDSNFIAHRVRKTKNELKQMGFDPELVDNLPVTSSDIEAGVIANSRINNLSPLNVSDVIFAGDELADKVWLHENYMKTSIPDGREVILQVFTVHQQVLEVNQVNEYPFTTFTPFPIPGTVWGESVYDVTKDLQDLGTTILRGIIDNVMNANFRRYIAVKGQYNRESLLNNRPGAIIEQMAAGSVDVFPYHQLPQGMDTLLQYVNDQKEERTGISKASQGLDPAVFKNDNSTATVQMVMTAALNRVRMVARNIAHGGMTHLMLNIYNLIRQNAKDPILVETANGLLKIDPKQLPERTRMQVAVAIGDAEKSQRAAKLQTLLMAMTQVPSMTQFLQPNNAYHLATQLFESAGIMDIENYLTPLDKIPPKQPTPLEAAQIALAQEQVKQAGVGTQKLVADLTMAQQKQEFEQQKAADEMDIKRNESNSKQDQLADTTALEEAKLEIEREKLRILRETNELKRQEMLIEAQMEARQQRPVSIVG